MDDTPSPAAPVEVAAPTPSPAARPKRKYVLTPRGRRSQAARAARRANLAQARTASKRLVYRPTAKRLAASRANLQKAIAARRRPQGNASARLNALKHGLFAKQVVAESVARLGEDPRKFQRLLRLVKRFCVPTDEEERQAVRQLAETLWRRLRFFTALRCWEERRLMKLFRETPRAKKLTPEETEERADALTLVLFEFDAFFRESRKVESQVEYQLRKLLRIRSGGRIHYQAYCPRRDPEMEEIEQWEKTNKAMDRWLAMSPEERGQLWEQVNREVAEKNRA